MHGITRLRWIFQYVVTVLFTFKILVSTVPYAGYICTAYVWANVSDSFVPMIIT